MVLGTEARTLYILEKQSSSPASGFQFHRRKWSLLNPRNVLQIISISRKSYPLSAILARNPTKLSATVANAFNSSTGKAEAGIY